MVIAYVTLRFRGLHFMNSMGRIEVGLTVRTKRFSFRSILRALPTSGFRKEPTKIRNVVVKGWLGRILLRRFLRSIACGST